MICMSISAIIFYYFYFFVGLGLSSSASVGYLGKITDCISINMQKETWAAIMNSKR